MSTGWGYKCITCGDTSYADIDHGEEIRRLIFSDGTNQTSGGEQRLIVDCEFKNTIEEKK